MVYSYKYTEGQYNTVRELSKTCKTLREVSKKSGIPYDTVRGWLRRGNKPIAVWTKDEWKRKTNNNAETRKKWTPERQKIFIDSLRKQKLGENNPNWKGDDVCMKNAEARDILKYKPVRELLLKITGNKWEVHHIDGNGKNQNEDNIAIVTRKGHMSIDGRLEIITELCKGGSLKSS